MKICTVAGPGSTGLEDSLGEHPTDSNRAAKEIMISSLGLTLNHRLLSESVVERFKETVPRIPLYCELPVLDLR